jgi:DNA gyrase subunit A
MCVVEDDSQVLGITTLGYGKRTDNSEYREQGRAGKGIIAMKLTEKTGDIAKMLTVKEKEDILLITDAGTIIRTPVSEIRVCGRATQGVRLMRLAEGAAIVDVARAEQEDEEPQGYDASVTSETAAGADDEQSI